MCVWIHTFLCVCLCFQEEKEGTTKILHHFPMARTSFHHIVMEKATSSSSWKAEEDNWMLKIWDSAGGHEIPLLLEGKFDTFEEYWDLWVIKKGPLLNFDIEGIVDSHHLEALVRECYSAALEIRRQNAELEAHRRGKFL